MLRKHPDILVPALPDIDERDKNLSAKQLVKLGRAIE